MSSAQEFDGAHTRCRGRSRGARHAGTPAGRALDRDTPSSAATSRAITARAMPFDLVIANVQMPGLNGIDLVKLLRADRSTQNVPVILMSRNAGQHETIAGLEAGADDFLVKPFSGRELLVRVQTRLELTAMRRRNAQQEDALASLQRTLRARDEFLSAASHELRTPITTLSLQTDGLLNIPGPGPHGGRRANDERMIRRLNAIRRQVVRLNQLVDQLLDVSRLIEGRLELRPEQVDLQALVIEAIDLMRESATQAGSPVLLRLRPEVVGHWDRIRIGQVITNLLSNAIKFGCGRPIEVELDADRPRRGSRSATPAKASCPRSRTRSFSASSAPPPCSGIPAWAWGCGFASRSSTRATDRSTCRASRATAPRSAWNFRGLPEFTAAGAAEAEILLRQPAKLLHHPVLPSGERAQKHAQDPERPRAVVERDAADVHAQETGDERHREQHRRHQREDVETIAEVGRELVLHVIVDGVLPFDHAFQQFDQILRLAHQAPPSVAVRVDERGALQSGDGQDRGAVADDSSPQRRGAASDLVECVDVGSFAVGEAAVLQHGGGPIEIQHLRRIAVDP